MENSSTSTNSSAFLKTKLRQQIGSEAHPFNLHVEEHRLANGQIYDYYVLHLPHFAVIIPKIDNDEYLLIKQYRPSWRRSVFEFPAGGANGYDEDPQKTAYRELEEEIGFKPGKLSLLGKFRHTSRSTQFCYSYVAENLEKGKQNLDDGEVIEEIRRVTGNEIEDMIKNEEIIDISHIATWYRYKALFDQKI